MPRGGKRPGAGRPPGALAWPRKELLRRIEAMDEPDLATRLAVVAEDSDAPEKVRLEACRHLAGALHSKIRLDVKGTGSKVA